MAGFPLFGSMKILNFCKIQPKVYYIPAVNQPDSGYLNRRIMEILEKNYLESVMKKKLFLFILILFSLFSCWNPLTARKPSNLPGHLNSETIENGIIFYGDTQKHHLLHKSIVENLLALNGQAVFHLGDPVSEGDRSLDWKIFDWVVSDLRSQMPFIPVIGNHEKGVEPQWYMDHWDFSIGQGYYPLILSEAGQLYQIPTNFDPRKGVFSDYSLLPQDSTAALQILVLHSNPGFLDPGSEQHRWLVEQLELLGDTPTILVFHIPLHMAGTHFEQQGDSHPAALLYTILEQKEYNIVACINGHDRSYQRHLDRLGVHHIVTGCAGETPDEQRTNPESLILYEGSYVFTLMNYHQENRALSFRAFDQDFVLLDSFAIQL